MTPAKFHHSLTVRILIINMDVHIIPNQWWVHHLWLQGHAKLYPSNLYFLTQKKTVRILMSTSLSPQTSQNFFFFFSHANILWKRESNEWIKQAWSVGFFSAIWNFSSGISLWKDGRNSEIPKHNTNCYSELKYDVDIFFTSTRRNIHKFQHTCKSSATVGYESLRSITAIPSGNFRIK